MSHSILTLTFLETNEDENYKATLFDQSNFLQIIKAIIKRIPKHN